MLPLESGLLHQTPQIRGDSGQNVAERTNSAIGDALVDGGTLNWEYFPIFHGLTDDEMKNLSVEEHARNEEIRMEKMHGELQRRLLKE